MNDNYDKFKLVTRRVIAWSAIILGMSTLSFVAVWSIMFCTGCQDLAAACISGIIFAMGAILGFYFKRLKDE